MKVYLANSTMPDQELAGITAAATTCKQIYVAAFVTVAAYRGSVALEGGLGGMIDSLIKSGRPVALMSLGSPYLLQNFPGVSAYVATFSTSNTSEIALAKAISGEIPIRGKLPVSIPGIAKIGDGIEVSRNAPAASQTVR
jgi:beta-N-acetylhexosaminidase